MLMATQASAVNVFDLADDTRITELADLTDVADLASLVNVGELIEGADPPAGPRYGRVWLGYMRYDDLLYLSFEQLQRMGGTHADTKPTAIHFHRSQQER